VDTSEFHGEKGCNFQCRVILYPISNGKKMMRMGALVRNWGFVVKK
jgi:hypothetical protein